VKEDMVDQFESDQKALDYVVEPAREQEKSYPSWITALLCRFVRTLIGGVYLLYNEA
jgi:hypothetical protein